MWSFYIVYFLTFIPFLSIFWVHDIKFTFVFIVFLLYYIFFVFSTICCFETPNILEADFRALYLIFNDKCEFICLCLLNSGVSIISINILCWDFYVYSYMIFAVIIIIALSCKYFTRLFHWIYWKIISSVFPKNYLKQIVYQQRLFFSIIQISDQMFYCCII